MESAYDRGGRRRLQDYTSLALFLKPQQWEVLVRVPEYPSNLQCLSMLVDHAAALGMRFPSEQTYAAFFVLLNQRHAHVWQKPALQLQAWYHQVKAQCRSYMTRANMSEREVPDGVYLSRLPDLFEDLPQVYKAAVFGEGQPAEPPVPYLRLRELMQAVPLRRTPYLQSGPPALQPMPIELSQAFAQTLMQVAHGKGLGRAGEVDIQYTQASSSARRALSLMPSMVPSPAPLQRLASSQDQSSQEQGSKTQAESSQEQHSQTQAEQAAASTVKSKAASAIVLAPPAPVEKAPEMPEPPAKSLTDTVAMLREKMEARASGTKRPASAEEEARSPKRRAQPPAVLRRAAAAKAVSKTPVAVPQAPVLKRPAAASSASGRKRPAAKPQMKKRMPCRSRRDQLYPKGCTKCRSTCGCTPSCWRARGFVTN